MCLSAQTPKDTNGQHPPQPQSVHPAAAGQEIQKYPLPNLPTTEQLLSPRRPVGSFVSMRPLVNRALFVLTGSARGLDWLRCFRSQSLTSSAFHSAGSFLMGHFPLKAAAWSDLRSDGLISSDLIDSVQSISGPFDSEQVHWIWWF